MSDKFINFTKKDIEKLQPPAKDRNIYRDIKDPRLGLMVYPNNKKVLYFIKSAKTDTGKKYLRKKIGDFPDLSIFDARAIVEMLGEQVAKGKNPFKKAPEPEKGITFRELYFDRYINNYARHNTKSWEDDVAEMNRKAGGLYDKEISAITKDEIRSLFDKLTAKGKYGANRFLDRLKAVFNKAIEWELLDKNPTGGIKKHKEKARDRYVTMEEKDRFFDAVRAEKDPVMRGCVLMSVYTGARKGNVSSMRWDKISFENKTWYVPDSDMKNNESQNIVLSDKALALLLEMRKTAKSEWVFPSKRSASGHIEDPRKAIARVCKRAGMEDFRFHDLRRTRGSWMAITGASTIVIGKTLNHKSPRSTAIYARLSLDPVREHIEKADDVFVPA